MMAPTDHTTSAASGDSPGVSRGPVPGEPVPTMEEAYGGVLRRLFGRAFTPVQVPAEAGEELRELASRGVVVYVSRSAALVTFLFFQHLMLRLGAPVAKAVVGLGAPIWKGWGRIVGGRRSMRAPCGEDVAAAVRRGQSALVFLRRPGSLVAQVRTLADPFPDLVRLQREFDRPIFLVPQILVWERRPQHLRRNLFDILFGEPEAPGFWRSTLSFLWNRRRAFVRFGTPVNLQAVLSESDGENDRIVARKVRGALYQHLARQVRVVTGPPLKSADRVIKETLRDRTLRGVIAEVSRERGRADGSVEREAERAVKEIAARYSPRTVELAKWLMDWVFERIYDGIEVDDAGLQRVAQTSATMPIVVCPSHKSHIDYLILSTVFFDRGLIPPHIAAGVNLSFWPLGPIFRKCGAFFIRRSFRGDRIYGAVLKAYVKKLLKDGFSQEFFVEGGRSRTGKVLQPRFGMLSMEVDAWLDGTRPDIAFVPVWIGYARIIEGRSYAHELGGGEKQKEDITALLSAPKVLASKYGRIYIRFDEPVSLAKLAEQRGFDRDHHTEGEKKALVRALGFRVVEGINRATALTPMGLISTALLSHDRRGLTAAELRDRLRFLIDLVLDAEGVLSFSPDEEALDPLADGPAAEACAQLRKDKALVVHESGGEHVFSVAEDQRVATDYYKNLAIHFFVADALVATGLLTTPGGQRAELQTRTRELSRILKKEFIYGAGPFEELFAGRVARLVRLGLVEERDGSLAPTESGAARVRQLADLLVHFVESYAITADALEVLRDGPLDFKDWMKRTLDRSKAAYLTGRIRRREAISRVTLENALAFFEEQGLVRRAGDRNRQLELVPDAASPEAVATRVAEIRSFIVPRE